MISAAFPQVYLHLWVCVGTSSRMDLSLHYRFGASRRPPLLVMMSFRRFLSALNGWPLATRCGIPYRSNVPEIAWRSDWYWFTCAPSLAQMHARRVSASTASQQGHLTAACSSIPMKRLSLIHI